MLDTFWNTTQPINEEIEPNQFDLRRNHKILILGESDFGLTLSLVEKYKIKPENIVTTTYKDGFSHELIYGGQTQSYKAKLEKLNVSIEHSIDATDENDAQLLLRNYHSFDRVLFTFPRKIIERGVPRMVYNSVNKDLLLNVSKNMISVLNRKHNEAAIYYVVLKTQVTDWDLKEIASTCGLKMDLVDFVFYMSKFPKYQLHTLCGRKVYLRDRDVCVVKFSCLWKFSKHT